MQPNQQSAINFNNNQPSLFGNNAPSLFANVNQTTSLTNNTGGLFGSVSNGGSLFSNNNNTQLKTTTRQQGGLFGNIITSNKDAKKQQMPPTLTFPGLVNNPNNPLFSSKVNTLLNQNKQQNRPKTSLFSSNPSSTLFSGSSLGGGTGGLFGDNKSTQSGNLFGQNKTITGPSLFGDKGKTQVPQQQNQLPTGGLFGNLNTSSSSNTGLFSKTLNPKKESKSTIQKDEKNQNPSTFNNPAPSFGSFNQGGSLFGNKSQNQNSKNQTSKEAPKNLTPNISLFGSSTNQKKNPPKQTSGFSLIGNANTSKDNTPSLFNKNNQSKNLENSKQTTQKNKLATNMSGGLFTNQTNTISLDGIFQDKKTKQTTSNTSLFSNNKSTDKILTKQKEKVQGTSLFQSKKDNPQERKQQKVSTLFSGNASLFGKTNPSTTIQTKKTQNLQQNKYHNKMTQNVNKQQKIPSGLLATFSNQQIQQQGGSRQTRTISFNQNCQNNIQVPTNMTNNSIPVQTQQKRQQVLKPTITQSLIKPSTSIPQTSPINKSKLMTQQTFFKSNDISKPQPQKDIIYTSFQINKLFTKTLLKKNNVNQSKSSQKINRNTIKSIQQCIILAFNRSNQIPISQTLQKKFILHQNQDINRFLNQLFRQVIVLINIPYQQNSFKLIHKLFDQLISKLGIKQTLFSCSKQQKVSQFADQNKVIIQPKGLNSAYFLKHQIYKFTPQGAQLNLDSEQLQQYIHALIRKFITNQLEYLQLIQNKIQLLRLPSQLFFNLISYCLKYKKFRISSSNIWHQKNQTVINLIQDFQKKIIQKVVLLLSRFVDENFYSFSLIDVKNRKENLKELIDLVQNFSYIEEQSIIDLSLKTILNSLELGATNTNIQNINNQFKSQIKDTKSLQLLPFRTLLSTLQNNSQRISPSAHDLYKYVNGPEWIDWLEICISNMNSATQRQISPSQAKYLIRILKYPSLGSRKINRQKLTPKQIKYVENLQRKILVRKRPIFKFIMALKEQNMLNMFYDILASLIYDYDSYRRIEQLFFKQKDQINYEFKNLIAEICNYPTQQFKQEIPFMEEKINYFLRIVEVAPQKTLALQKLIFQGVSVSSKRNILEQEKISSKQLKNYIQDLEVGHKICHLIIDTTNYFGLKNNQKIVSKCISAIKSLLQKTQTSLAMKIAMAINKPTIMFINNPMVQSHKIHLTQSLVKQMIQLLQYFLVSQQFSNTVAVNLHTNNSENVELQKMYSIRYSDKDYLPFVKELIDYQYNKKLQKQWNLTLYKSQSNIILTYSSYWFLKALQVFVHAFRQQKVTSSSNQRKLLYMLNLILQKFFILPSSQILNEDKNTKMLDQSTDIRNIPLYSTNSSAFIPKIFQYLTQALNAIQIIPILSQNLKYKILKSGYIFDQKDSSKKRPNYILTNQKLQEDFNQNQFNVFLSIKILKQLLQTYRLYENYKNKPLRQGSSEQFKKSERNFMFKLLSKLKCIHQLQFSMFLKGFASLDVNNQENGILNSRPNLVIGLIALLLVDNQNQNSTKKSQKSDYQAQNQSKPINLKQQNYQKPYIIPIQQNYQQKKATNQLSNFDKVQLFYSNYGNTLNYQVLNNFIITTSNKYIESYESLQYLSISCLSLLISGETVFGDKTCDKSMQNSINIPKYVGLYNLTNLDLKTNQLFSNQWLLDRLQNNLLRLLVSNNSSIQVKYSILNFILQITKNDKSNSNFVIAKRIFYQYISKHLEQQKYYSEEEVNRLNVIAIKIMNLLFDKDILTFSQLVHDKLLDTLLVKMINNSTTCSKSSQDLKKIMKSFKQRQYYQPQLSYYHLQRSVQERQIIKIGQAFQLIKQISILIQKKFFQNNCLNDHKWKCIKKLNNLIINFNLAHLSSIMVDQHFVVPKLFQITNLSLTKNLTNFYVNIPRSFIKNSFQIFLTEATHTSYVQDAFQIFKQNIIDWIAYNSIQLTKVVLRFLTWTLTIDKTLYGNQPNQTKSWQLSQKKNSNIICELHMGSYNHSALQLFADSQGQGINIVKVLYDQTLKNLQNGMTTNQIQSFAILGYCLEWLRAKKNTTLILEHLVRSTLKNRFWLNSLTVQSSIVIKYILSLVTLGKSFMNKNQFKYLKEIIIEVIHQFKSGKSQVQQVLVQQLLCILISIPPEVEDLRVFKQILTIWKTQSNNQFFYNQARLVLQLASKYPNQVAKNKVLSENKKLNKCSTHSQYIYNLRNPQSISFIWALKIASTLMSNQQQTIIILEEVSNFYNLKRQQIYTFLLKDITNLTLAYLEQLQSLLQFFITLVSSKSWLAVQRNQFQKLLYILSHKFINVFTDFMSSKLTFVAQSDIQQRFKKIRFESYVEQVNANENIQNETLVDKDSVFKMIMEMKMIKCCKLYTILLSQSFQQSWYIHKYFNQEVYQNYRYGVSFWDRLNKSIGDMIRYNVLLLKKWKKSTNLNQKLQLVSQCVNCSQYFVQTGYLTSILDVPSTSDQLFQDIYSLNFQGYELGTVHLIQQKQFRQKYQCLMKGNIQKYGKRLIQNIKNLSLQFDQQQLKTLKYSFGEIKKLNFQKIQKNINSLIKTI